MLFFYNHVLFTAIAAFAFLQPTFAAPLPVWVPKILLYELRLGTQRKYLPVRDYSIVEHGAGARKEIAGMGLKGHQVSEVKNWHENHAVKAMKTHPSLKGVAHSATIEYVSTLTIFGYVAHLFPDTLLTRVEATLRRRTTSLQPSMTKRKMSFPIASTAGCVLSLHLREWTNL